MRALSRDASISFTVHLPNVDEGGAHGDTVSMRAVLRNPNDVDIMIDVLTHIQKILRCNLKEDGA